MGVFFPNQEDRGTHINVSGAGVTASARNRDNAILLIEFLTSLEAQQRFAEANYEYPVNPEAAATPLLESWGAFRADPINLAAYGENNAEAVRIFDRVGWR
jgi:iron(III) transport system substrate-binding protein